MLRFCQWSEVPSKRRGLRWFTVRKTTCFTKTPHILYRWVCGVVLRDQQQTNKQTKTKYQLTCTSVKRSLLRSKMAARIRRGATRVIFELHKTLQCPQSISNQDFCWGILHSSESVGFGFFFFWLHITGGVLGLCRFHVLQSTSHTTLFLF